MIVWRATGNSIKDCAMMHRNYMNALKSLTSLDEVMIPWLGDMEDSEVEVLKSGELIRAELRTRRKLRKE